MCLTGSSRGEFVTSLMFWSSVNDRSMNFQMSFSGKQECQYHGILFSNIVHQKTCLSHCLFKRFEKAITYCWITQIKIIVNSFFLNE